MRRFVAYLREYHPQVHHFSQIQRQPHIEGWIEQLLCLKAVTRNNYIRTLRLFFEDIIRWQWTQAPPPGLLSNADLSPEEACLPRPLPPELDQAVQKAFIEADTFGAMALLLLRYTGMRLGEMRALPLNALEPSGPDIFSLRVPVGKTHTQRLIPLDERTVDLIRRIVAQRACRQKRRLFLQCVSDAEGLSFYSDERICEYLHFSLNGLWKAREGLVQGGFLLYSRPIYQLLNLPEPSRWE